MIVLGIETSCDETALSIIDGRGGTNITVLADKTLSQIEFHKQYGGVFPNMAKREHNANLIPLLKTVLLESNLISNSPNYLISNEKTEKIKEILNRETELLANFLEFIPTIEKPPIDAIAVTEGPGLEPCLWTGVNLARALSFVWDIPVIPVNHMEGHIFSALLRKTEISNSPNYLISNKIPNSKAEKLNATRYTLNAFSINYQLKAISFPALALLISGGHTELVLMKDWFAYEIIGQTRDDAVGEAFDKVARLLGLPYPGGSPLSALAEQERKLRVESLKFKVEEDLSTYQPTNLQTIHLPRPMLHSDDFDFSFSGLKTSVLYLIKKLPELTQEIKAKIALEFENAVTEVLVAKTKKAIERFGAQSLLIGGGVIANTHIRRAFEDLAFAHGRRQMLNGDFLHIPEKQLTTDNALMIAVAGYYRFSSRNVSGTVPKREIKPKGNLALDE